MDNFRTGKLIRQLALLHTIDALAAAGRSFTDISRVFNDYGVLGPSGHTINWTTPSISHLRNRHGAVPEEVGRACVKAVGDIVPPEELI